MKKNNFLLLLLLPLLSANVEAQTVTFAEHIAPNNPSSPPQDVTWGERTTDEMFYLSFFFALYQNGDENIVIPNDTLLLGPPLISALDRFELPKNKFYPPYPNPAKDELTLAFSVATAPTELQFDLVDYLGRTLQTETQYYPQGQHLRNFALPNLPTGSYFLRISGKDFSETRSFIIAN